ncbi:MAG: hypothetical protein CFE44_11010 [Burkholderiales bacterium PBB4]|nr:MAG: hypothetical protein CFE44_11010 [Burkholderiales bacterium PBB4]
MLTTYFLRQIETLRTICRFVLFVSKTFRFFYLVLFLALVVLGLEYFAVSLMMPLSVSNALTASPVVNLVGPWIKALGYEATIRYWLWLFLFVMVLRLGLGYVLTVSAIFLSKSVHERLGGKVFAHIVQHEPMGMIYSRSVGHYLTLAGDDAFKCGTILLSLIQLVVGLFSAIIALTVLLGFSYPIFIFVLVFLFFCSLLLFGMFFLMVRKNDNAITSSRIEKTTFVESLNGVRSLRVLGGSNYISGLYLSQLHSYIQNLIWIDVIKNGAKSAPAIILLILALVLLSFSDAAGLTEVTLAVGTLIVIRVFTSLGQVITAGAQLLTDIRAIKDIGALVELAQARSKSTHAAASDCVRTLALQQVSFAYGDRGRVLADVSFRFEAGHTYAVVGPSGAGKSTLADIMLGLSVPDSGQVVVNEGRIPLESARSHFMLVEQQPKIFSTTVKENLLLGAHVSDEELYAALESVNLDGLIRSLDKGLDTQLSYLGENLSGGQRQRLGIARALIRKPEVLLLDEATSALDSKTRVEVVGKLRAAMRDGIIIFITHDPEIAALADKVLLIGQSSTIQAVAAS